jgi:hypothetical protein
MLRAMSDRLCPKCGAYWRCDCIIEELVPTLDITCNHDWIDAVGVEHDAEAYPEGARVLMCRLCGLYAVAVADGYPA